MYREEVSLTLPCLWFTELQFQCSACSKRFPSERLARDHFRNHINHWKCSHCDMTCSSQFNLEKHIHYRHTSLREHECSHCDKAWVMWIVIVFLMMMLLMLWPCWCCYDVVVLDDDAVDVVMTLFLMIMLMLFWRCSCYWWCWCYDVVVVVVVISDVVVDFAFVWSSTLDKPSRLLLLFAVPVWEFCSILAYCLPI